MTIVVGESLPRESVVVAEQSATPEAATPKMEKAQKRHRISEIDLEIAHLQNEKSRLRTELAAK